MNKNKEDYSPRWLKKIEPYANVMASVATALAIIFLLRADCNTSTQIDIMRKQWNEERRPKIYLKTMDCQVISGKIHANGLIENVGLSVASNVEVKWKVREKETLKNSGIDSAIIGPLFPHKPSNVEIFVRKATGIDYVLQIYVYWTWEALNIRDSMVYDQIILNSDNIDSCSCKNIEKGNIPEFWGN
jgi:hypothetical protein